MASSGPAEWFGLDRRTGLALGVGAVIGAVSGALAYREIQCKKAKKAAGGAVCWRAVSRHAQRLPAKRSAATAAESFLPIVKDNEGDNEVGTFVWLFRRMPATRD
jgi:hypothetical protein